MARFRNANTVPPFKWQPFSKKQLQLLTWWMDSSPYKDYFMVIADGSVRAGKTVSMIDSFITWSLHTHKNAEFIIAGKSMSSLKRNVVKDLFKILQSKGLAYNYNQSENYIEIGTNTYYLFGAVNNSSYETLQGMTAAGALADEIALFPENFVDQMKARCSVKGAKIFANCNPMSPFHFIKKDYIDEAHIPENKILHLHFRMEDNLTLDKDTLNRYKTMYKGVFYRRYILGEWVMAEGLIYSMFDHTKNVKKHNELPMMKNYWIGIDYGTSNATTFILCGEGNDGKFYVINEYYHSGSESNIQKSPGQYSQDYIKWIDSLKDSHGNEIKQRLDKTFIDPSAEGFIITLHNDGVKRISKANNKVKWGIENVSSLISGDSFYVSDACPYVIKEMSTYSWDPKAQERGEDKPLKANDHCMDPIRYVVNGTYNIWRRNGLL